MGCFQLGYLDIPYEVMVQYMHEIEKKKKVCKKLPSARMAIHNEGIIYNGLVCDRMGGLSTGISAEHCKNCIINRRLK